MHDRLRVGHDGIVRCWWPGDDPEYVRYHDHEWGRPVKDDTRLFEKLCLEAFQSGLSWITILRKRENFRRAFAGFDFRAVAGFDEGDVERLMGDAGIVRNRAKIEATVNNAARCAELVADFGSLSSYIWSYEPPRQAPGAQLISQSEVSTQLSKDLKKRGWRFVGPTTVYAFMQAMGLVNDHIEGCAIRDVCEQARAGRSTR